MAQMKRSNTTLWFSMVYLWVIYGYSPWLSNVRIKTAGEVSDPLEKLDWLQAGMGYHRGYTTGGPRPIQQSVMGDI